MDNLAADEEQPWEGYYPSMIKQLERRTNCTTDEATCAIQQACEPQTLTLGDLANRRIDLEISIEKLLSLLVDLNGPYVEKYEVVQKARHVLSQKVGSWQPI